MLVRVEAVAVNPVDTFVRSGRYATEVPLPLALGRDLVGRRVDTGERVWCNSAGHNGRQGATTELAAVPRDRLYPLPAGVDPVEAVVVLHPAATAYLGLVHHAGLRPGETVCVVGGNGSVGAAAVRTAALLGARVVAVARDEPAMAYCRQLGAQLVLGPADRLPPVDVHVDTSGTVELADAVAVTAPRGRVLVLAGGDRTARLPVGAFYTRDVRLLGFVISRATAAELAAAATHVNALLAGGFRLPVADVLPFAAAADAHRRLEAGPLPRVGGARGRIALVPDRRGVD